MRVLFLNPCPNEQGKNHLYRKFYSQIESGVKLGDDVYYSTYDNNYLYLNHVLEDGIEKEIIGRNIYPERNVLIMHQMMRRIRPIIRKMHFDFVYMRYIPPTYTHKLTQRMFRKNGSKVVVEIPSYPGNELDLSSRKLYFTMVRIAKKIFSSDKEVDLYCLIGEHADKYKGVDAINIENGLDVESIPIKKQFSNHNGELHMLVVAVIQYWHGYDRIIKGMSNYFACNGERKVYLHICGTCHDGSLEEMLQYADEHGFSDRIIYHGYQAGSNLDSIFDECDVAFGSLGLHRSGIRVDTTLKLPEYTARGIPFVYCTESNNVDPDGKYYLRIPDDDSDVNVNDVVEFFDSISKDTIINQMHQYAEKNIQWSIQLEKIKKKIKEIEND